MFVISRYIKIKPLQAWGINMNCCVWFVNLHGIDEKDFLYNMIKHNYDLITSECYKIVYNFLKKENKIETLNVLQKEANLHTESDIVKKIRKLVYSEDFDGLEALFLIALKRNLINRKEYLVGKWTRITNVNEPKPRGGHAMASFEDKLFLHGGWDGTEELNDFWVFDCTTETWTKKDINLQTRSCHKMIVFYSKRFEDEIRREMVEKELKDENFNEYNKRDFPARDYKNLNDVINTNLIENRNIKKNEIKNNLVFDQKIGEKNNDLMNKKNIIIDKEGFDKDQYVLKNGNNKQSSLEPYLIVIGKYVQKEKNPQKMDISIHNIKRNLTFLVDYYGEMENIYDHQLATNSHEIYMMGGRTIAPRSCEYGGLYEFKNKNFIRLDTTKNIDLQERVAHNLIYYENYKYLDINEFKNSGNSDLFNIKKFDDNSKDYNKKNDSENEQKNSHFDDKTLNQKHMMPDHKNNRQKESVHLQNSNPKDSNYLEEKSKNNYSFEKQNDFMQNNKNSSKNLNHFFIAKKNLIIIGGYKERSHYADISFFDLDSKTVYKRIPFPKKHNGKILSRCELIDDFLVLYLSYENSKTSLYESSELYQYDILNDKWLNLNVSSSFPNARSAHSFTYNKETNSLYVFGGNVSDKNTQSRNNEMWKLNIQGIDDNSMMNKIRFCIRKYKFISLIGKDLRNALTFLQNDVYDVVDHENIYEEKIFKKIVLELYKEERRLNNEEIVQELCKFLIDDLKIESKNLFEMLE
ncbi:Muskelin 1 [Gurleya vavrai]